MGETDVRLDAVVIDCGDAQKLADFYASLLGWAQKKVNDSVYLVACPHAPLRLFINQEEDYAPPVWPEEPGRQQKSLHLDFTVENLDAAVARAVSLGARLSTYQFLPEKWKTLFDPAGHPFCLCL